MKETIKSNWELERSRKYTRLYLKGKVFQQWINDDIDLTLKTNDFNKQVEWFRNNIKG